jgi:FMN-dependent NADH-azoreductase
MKLFRLDASIRTDDSVSRAVADAVERSWLDAHPGEGAPSVVRRDLGRRPLPAEAWSLAATAGQAAAEGRTPEQVEAVALAARLADELLSADAAVVTSPLYNFGVPQHVKAWIDLLITDSRLAPGQQPLAGRPLVLVVARGGGYAPGTPREGWDHATPYLLRIFGEVFGMDVTLVDAELTLAEVNPAMAALRELGAASRAQAHARAETAGRNLHRSAAAAA